MFPHDADLDKLGGVDFKKGCFIGQEVVSRVEHRGTARNRIVPVAFDAHAAEDGSTVMAGDKNVGTMGSSAGSIGLAMLRVDRVADALAAGVPLLAGGIPMTLRDGDRRFLQRHQGQCGGHEMKAITHADGLTRCPWPKDDPLYVCLSRHRMGRAGI